MSLFFLLSLLLATLLAGLLIGYVLGQWQALAEWRPTDAHQLRAFQDGMAAGQQLEREKADLGL